MQGGRSHVRFQPRFGRFLATVTSSPTYINIIDTQNWSIVDSLKVSLEVKLNSRPLLCNLSTISAFMYLISYFDFQLGEPCRPD